MKLTIGSHLGPRDVTREGQRIVRALEKDRRGSRKFGSNALNVDGRIFAMFAQGKLIVKLPKVK